jgi:hypothetical protein
VLFSQCKPDCKHSPQNPGRQDKNYQYKSEQNFFVFDGNDPVIATRALIGIFGIEMVPLKVSLIS